jgi:hypothetical protein
MIFAYFFYPWRSMMIAFVRYSLQIIGGGGGGITYYS